MDSRVRDTHKAMSGQEQALGQAFQSPSGAVLRYPGDPLAPLAEIAQCRCHLTFKIDPTALEFAKAFDPNQPRDRNGRWTASGAGGGLRGFLKTALVDHRGGHQVYDAGPVQNAAAIKDAGGPDATGWRRLLESSEVRHALKEHGVGSPKWARGDRVAQADLRLIDRIVSAAKPTVTRKKGGDVRIGYKAEIDGRTYTYFETASRKRSALLFKTMWRRG